MKTIHAQQWFAHRLWNLAHAINSLGMALFHTPFCVRRVTCGRCKKRHWAFRVRELNDTAEHYGHSEGITYPVCKKCYDETPF